MNHTHRYLFLETSHITVDNQKIKIDKYYCTECNKLYIMNSDKKERIFLDHAIGEEVE